MQTTSPAEVRDAGLDSEFKRGLGLYDATMVVVGSMIGSGIFIVSADMARLIGSPGWLLLAWVLTGVSVVATIADTVILARAYGLVSTVALSEKNWPLVDAAAVGSCVVGALIVSRLPGNPIGWLLSVVGFVGGIALFGESYSVWVVKKDGPGSEVMGHSVGWVAALVALGHTNQDTARSLGVTRRAVEKTLTRLYRRLDVAGRAELAPVVRRMAGEAAFRSGVLSLNF